MSRDQASPGIQARKHFSPSDLLVASDKTILRKARAIEDNLQDGFRRVYTEGLERSRFAVRNSVNKREQFGVEAGLWAAKIGEKAQYGIDHFREIVAQNGNGFRWALWRVGTALICSEVPNSTKWNDLERVEYDLGRLSNELLIEYVRRFVVQVCDDGPHVLEQGRFWSAPALVTDAEDCIPALITQGEIETLQTQFPDWHIHSVMDRKDIKKIKELFVGWKPASPIVDPLLNQVAADVGDCIEGAISRAHNLNNECEQQTDESIEKRGAPMSESIKAALTILVEKPHLNLGKGLRTEMTYRAKIVDLPYPPDYFTNDRWLDCTPKDEWDRFSEAVRPYWTEIKKGKREKVSPFRRYHKHG